MSSRYINRPIPSYPTIRKVPKTPENLVEETLAADENPANVQLPSPMSMDFERADVDQRGRVVVGAQGPYCVMDRYPHTMAANREMTLKMTLTRKDLRDEDSTPPVTPEQALELEQLPPENTTVDWDAIDREAESSIRRLWRKVAKRQN